MTGLRIERETFTGLGPRWEGLLERAAANNIFLSPDWQRLWWDSLADDEEMLLSACLDDNDLIGVLPLKRKEGQLSFIGSANVCDYMDFVVAHGREREVYEAIGEHVLGLEWNALELNGVDGQSPTITHLVEFLRSRGVEVTLRPEEVCPTVKLPGTWDEYLSGLNKKDRHELRRKLRRLYSAGDVRYHVAAQCDGFPNDLEVFLGLLENSRADKAAFMTPKMRGFFKNSLTGLAKSGSVRLSFLEVDGERVSSTVCFDYDNRYFLYNSGFNTEYSHLSVGLLLKALCLKAAIEAGKTEFNFLRGSEPYKYHLGAVDEVVHTISASR